MGMVKVWNDHDRVDPKKNRDTENPLDKGFDGTWVEVFQDEEIVIPPKSYVEMDWEKATLFVSQYYPMAFDGNDQQLLRSKKRIRIEGAAGPKVAQTERVYVCQADGSEHVSKAALDAYVKENHADLMTDDEAKKELLGGKRKAAS